MKIDSYKDLEFLEKMITNLIQMYPLDALLIGIRESKDRFEPFVRAGITLFAIRYCIPGPKIEEVQTVNQKDLAGIAHLVGNYLLSDPIIFDQKERSDFMSSNPIFMILRLIGHQLPFSSSTFGRHAQPFMLFKRIPNYLKGRSPDYTFDIESAFFDLNGFTITDFLDICFIIHSVANNNTHFTRAYLEKSCESFNVPDKKTLAKILDSIAGDPEKISASYYNFQNENRKYRMYDLNPLFLYPVIRPWSHNNYVPSSKDRLIAPIPDLITYRMSTGVYYQLFNEYKSKFSDSFGIVFENYVGWILKESVGEKKVFTERKIRKIYREKLGSVPDYALLEDESVVLIECKATKFTRRAMVTGQEDYVINSLKQLIKGLKQLATFRKACIDKHPSLSKFHKYRSFEVVLLTLEPLYLINSSLFREIINDELSKDGVEKLDWIIISINELEALQPHFKAGKNLSSVISNLKTKNFNTVLEDLNKLSTKTYRDCCLYQVENEMYERIGI